MKLSRTQYILTCLIEECAEIQQRATKAMRFGCDEKQPDQDKNNMCRLQEEIADFFTVFDLLKDTPEWVGFAVTDNRQVSKLMSAKLDKLEKYYQHSVECGTAEPGTLTT